MMRKFFYLFWMVWVCGSCSENGIPKNNDNRILSFTIHTVEGVISGKEKTITVVMPYGTSLTALTPTIVIPDLAKIFPPSGVEQNFTDTVKYVVTAENGYFATYSAVVVAGDFGTKISSVSALEVVPGGELVLNGVFAADRNEAALLDTDHTYPLNIVEQDSSRIKVEIPLDIPDGSYFLQAVSNGIKALYSEELVVRSVE